MQKPLAYYEAGKLSCSRSTMGTVKPLPVDFGPIIPDNIEQLRKINEAAFACLYKEAFYRDIIKHNNEKLNKFAFYRGLIVGAVCARIEDLNEECEANNAHPRPQRLYIMTLAVLASYRGRGVGSQLLQSLLDSCASIPGLREIALHVQVSNDDAIRFYTKHFGFERGELVENYYRRLDPPHCYLLYKRLDEAIQAHTPGCDHFHN